MAMDLQELMDKIQLPKEAQDIVYMTNISDDEFAKKREQFLEQETLFLEELKNKKDWKKWALRFYLENACLTYDEFVKDGISDQIYFETMSDFTIWVKECKRKYQEYGLAEVFWLGRSVKRELYRLGRLQFQPDELKEEIVSKGKTWEIGTKVLGVHIPEGDALKLEDAVESFQKAKEFFGDCFELFVCDSWLLSPHLKEVLTESSNILRFQNLFEIVKVHYEFPRAEERIFKDVLEDKTKYPERTSLQRNAKKKILEGYDLGIGFGMIEAFPNEISI